MSRLADLDAQRIASMNSRVDLEKIRQLDLVVGKLRAAGFPDKGYELGLPFQKPVPNGSSGSAQSHRRRRR